MGRGLPGKVVETGGIPVADYFSQSHTFVIPAKAGTQDKISRHTLWIPAFAGVTKVGERPLTPPKPLAARSPDMFEDPADARAARGGGAGDDELFGRVRAAVAVDPQAFLDLQHAVGGAELP